MKPFQASRFRGAARKFNWQGKVEANRSVFSCQSNVEMVEQNKIVRGKEF